MAHKFRFLIGIWLVLIGSQLSGHLAQTSKPPTSISEPNTMITTAAYLDDSQLVNTIGNDDCGCLANYEIKISNDAMYTGQLIRCTNVRRFNHLSLISRLSAVAKCSQLEQQFNEMWVFLFEFWWLCEGAWPVVLEARLGASSFDRETGCSLKFNYQLSHEAIYKICKVNH